MLPVDNAASASSASVQIPHSAAVPDEPAAEAETTVKILPTAIVPSPAPIAAQSVSPTLTILICEPTTALAGSIALASNLDTKNFEAPFWRTIKPSPSAVILPPVGLILVLTTGYV